MYVTCKIKQVSASYTHVFVCAYCMYMYVNNDGVEVVMCIKHLDSGLYCISGVLKTYTYYYVVGTCFQV